jgi:hypothetical protein
MRFEGAFTNLLNHPNFAPPADNRHGVLVWRAPEQTAENSGNRTGQLGLRFKF